MKKENQLQIEYGKFLWSSARKKLCTISIIVFILMLLVANVYLAINAMGALSEHASAKSVVHFIFPVLQLGCCLTASIAMSVKTKESRRMISPYQEFRMRWTLFILLPFLFYILTAYFFDGLICAGKGQILPWQMRMSNDSYIYYLPIIFLSTSFFFLLSTFISHKALQISVPLCCLIFYKEISALSLDNMSLDYEKYPIFGFENFAIIVLALLTLADAYYNIKENKDITSEENE
jgi:hypothetical protein